MSILRKELFRIWSERKGKVRNFKSGKVESKFIRRLWRVIVFSICVIISGLHYVSYGLG